jgi:hypothetical protein
MTEKNGAKAPNKNEAVYLALQELGTDAKRGPIREFVKERFGIDMNPDHVSTARGEALRKMAGDGKPAPKESPPAAEAEPAAPREPAGVEQAAPDAAAQTPLREKSSPTSSSTAVELDDLIALKALVGRVGAENLRRLIDIVG